MLVIARMKWHFLFDISHLIEMHTGQEVNVCL